MVKRDYYDILGVNKGANADEIKKAYRKLARKYHPDTSGNDKAKAEQFKEVQEAYETLSDTEKRRNFDRFGHTGSNSFNSKSSGGFGSAGRGGMEFDFADLFGSSGGGGFGDLFGSMTGRSRRQRPSKPPTKGQDINHSVTISFDEMTSGTTRDVALTLTEGRRQSQQKLEVKIPQGIKDGGKIRLRGKGQLAPGGPGDLIITVNVQTHRYFKRDENDILLDVPLTITEAALGTKIDVPTLHDKTTVTIPSASSGGRKLRLRGKGISNGKTTGDMYLILKIILPDNIDDSSKELLEQFAAQNPQDDIRNSWD
ncbi:MAG: J domain-containing protein [Phycisphaerae bacterium]|nr:J domain-containing protein [Phycisphaerae bacterium]